MSNDENTDDDHIDDDPVDDGKNRAMQVDDNLRRVYNDILEEDVPERFRELLSRLKEQESNDADEPSASGESEGKDA